jgi:opacity protein-like surface antigen
MLFNNNKGAGMKKLIVIVRICGAAVMITSGVVLAADVKSSIYIGVGYGKVAVAEGEIQYGNTSSPYSGSLHLGYELNDFFALEAQYISTTKNAKGSYRLEDIDIAPIFWNELITNTPDLTLADAMSLYPEANADVDLQMTGALDAYALYGVYRSAGNLYIKAKLGAVNAQTKVTASPSSIALSLQDFTGVVALTHLQKGDEGFSGLVENAVVTQTENKVSLSGGVGVGYELNTQLKLELEYTRLTSDIEIGSLSVQYHF